MPVEKIKPKMVTVTGTCKYCHQQKVTKVREGTTQNEIDEIVSGECGCPLSCEEIERKTSYTMMINQIHRVCQQTREQRPTDKKLLQRWNEIQILFVILASMISRGLIKKASISLDSQNTWTLSRTSKDKLKLKMTFKDDEDSEF